MCSLSVRDSAMNSLAGLTELSLLSCYLPRNLIHDIEPQASSNGTSRAISIPTELEFPATGTVRDGTGSVDPDWL